MSDSDSKKNSDDPGFKVELWLYDLSRGMAKAMSQGLLGKQIDGIWHSGVVVYGYEYFYGGGIQASRPGCTQAGSPVRKIDLGATHIPQEVFHEYLQSVSHKYGPHTYNIVSNNCNNFADEIANFLTDKPIPEFITGLPEEALNTPLGQMFKPMLENMQSQMSGMVPWASGALALPPINKNPPKASVKASESKSKPAEAKKSSESTQPKYKDLKLKAVKASPRLIVQKAADYSKIIVSLLKLNARVKSKDRTIAMSDDAAKALASLGKSLGDVKVPISSPVSQAVETLLIKLNPKLLFPVVGVYQGFMLRSYERKKLLDSKNPVISLFIKIVNTDAPKTHLVKIAILVAFCNMFQETTLADVLTANEDFLSMLVNALEAKETMVRLTASRLAFNVAVHLPKNSEADGVIQLASFLPTACEEESDAKVCHGLLLALGQLVYGSEEAVEVATAFDFDANKVADRFKATKMCLGFSNLACDVNAILAASAE